MILLLLDGLAVSLRGGIDQNKPKDIKTSVMESKVESSIYIYIYIEMFSDGYNGFCNEEDAELTE